MPRFGQTRSASATNEVDDFGALWDEYAQTIYLYCFRRTADSALAEDLTSIVFLEAWRRRDAKVAAETMLAWLYGIAGNVLRNQRRSQRRYESALRRMPRPDVEPDFAESSTGRMDDELQMREILEQLEQLSELEQEVLGLCVWQELSPSDAARALDIPEPTVRTRLHRAREHLRRQSLASDWSTPNIDPTHGRDEGAEPA